MFVRARIVPVMGFVVFVLITLFGARFASENAQAATELDAAVTARTADDGVWPPSYAQLVAEVNEAATPEDYVLTAAGGLPGEIKLPEALAGELNERHAPRAAVPDRGEQAAVFPKRPFGSGLIPQHQ